MAGIYIHIPFCRSRCIYCGFYSTTGLELRQRYVDAVCREVVLSGEWREESGERYDIETIYFGGGTPSQLTIPQLTQLFIYINKVYSLTSHLSPLTSKHYSLTSHLSPLTSQEITLEMNPDDVTAEYAEALVKLGVNRVSMGVQTFNDERLRFLCRRHTAKQVYQAVETLRQAGIGNISIDLMYGFPDETLDDWKADIDGALSLGVEHISTYCLMIEEGTPLYRLMEQGKVSEMDEELERQMYYDLIDRLEAAGYEHYEISNFARPGFRSRHNSSYWNQTPYIGLGAAAHSFDGKKCRRWNVADIHQYIEGIEKGQPCFEQEVMDEDTQYNDLVTVALRTKEGLDLHQLSERHRTYALKNAQRFLNDGLLEVKGDKRLVLTRKGLFVSDMIMSELMWTD